MNARYYYLLASFCLLLRPSAVHAQCIDLHCPSNVVAQCTSPAGANVSYAVTATNLCGTNVSLFCLPPSGATYPSGSTLVNCTAVGSGQTNRCTFTVFVLGNCSTNTTNCITLRCPSNLLVQCQGDVPRATSVAALVALGGGVTDLCNTNVALTSTDSPISGSSCGGSFVRTYVATDALGNSASCTQVITVRDTIPPVLVGVPGDTNFPCIGFLPSAFVTATDNCDGTNVAVQLSVTTNGTCPKVIVRTWTAHDHCTNTAVATQTIVLLDAIPPVILCPSNLFVQCIGDVPPCPANIAQFRARGGIATDNCGSNLTYRCSDSPMDGTPCFGTITRTHTVIDDCTNASSCVQIITVRDTLPPVLVGVPAGGQFDCSGNLPPMPTVTAIDNCDSNVVVIRQTITNGICPKFVIWTWRATDSCSNTTFAVVTNVIGATAPPVVICPGNITVESCTNRAVFFQGFVTNNCDSNVSLVCTPPSGATFSLGTTTVHCSSSNACGAFASCSFTVTLTCPSNACLTIANERSVCLSNRAFTTTFDLRNLTPTPVSYVVFTDLPPGVTTAPDVLHLATPLAPGASTTVTVTIQDGNVITMSSICFRVSIHNANFQQCCVVDHCVPVPSCCMEISGQNLQCSNSSGGLSYSFDLRNVSGVTARYLFLTPAADCFSITPAALTLQPPLPSGAVRHFNVTLQNVRPECGSSLCFLFALLDSNMVQCCSITNCVANPVVTHLDCPTNIVVQCSSAGGTSVFYTPHASTLCASNVPLSCVPPSGTQFPAGSTTAVHCQTIGGGVTNVCGFNVSVVGACSNCVDILCPSNILNQCLGVTGTRVTYAPQVFNLCGSALPEAFCSPASGSLFPPGTTLVTCQAVNAGVTNRCTFNVRIIEGCQGSPCLDLHCSTNITASCNSAAGTAVSYSLFAINQCSTNTLITCTPPSGSTFPPGVTTVHCTAIGSGATNFCNFTVSIIGNCPGASPMNFAVARAGGMVQLSVQTAAGVTCLVESADSFVSPEWTPFQTIVGDGSVMVITDFVSASSQRFYRVRMDP